MSASVAASAGDDRSRSLRALDAVNFFLADVRDGLGPFLGIFLVGKGWDAATIGLVMTIGGIAGMLATTPLGALADATKAKRFIVAFCAALTIAASLIILFRHGFALVTASQVATGIAGAAIGPAIAGLTLGLVGQDGLAAQLGRNEAWNHAGNVVAAVAAGYFGYAFGLPAVFLLMTVMAIGSIAAVCMIREGDIDHDVARGLEGTRGDDKEGPAAFGVLWRSTPLLILAATLMMFHFGNGAMLPLLGQQVASEASAQTTQAEGATVAQTGVAPATSTGGRPAAQPSMLHALLNDPVAFTALTVVIAQLAMIPVAILAASFAGRRGYYLLLVAALVALPIRGAIAGLWPGEFSVVPVQILDGVGAGLLGVAVPGLVARILRGTGHVNAGLGAVMTVQGIGASLSPALAGWVVTTWSYSAAYLMLAVFGLAGLALWLLNSQRLSKACA